MFLIRHHCFHFDTHLNNNFLSSFYCVVIIVIMPLFDESVLLLKRRRLPNVVYVDAHNSVANLTQVGSNGSITDSF